MAGHETVQGRIEQLERELSLKQLQIQRLLTITQAINNNLSSQDLYSMFNSFLSWEMGVERMALFVKQDGEWICPSYFGVQPEVFIPSLVNAELSAFKRLRNITESDHPVFRDFEVVIPVHHKDFPIAYAFISGLGPGEESYNKVQFIIAITNIIAVAIENKRLFKRQIEQERFKYELRLASEMQRMLVPAELPSNACYELASIYLPHLSVGGDYFDFAEPDPQSLAVCVADISGKGLAAALLMANFQANFHALLRQGKPLEEFIQDLNKSVLRITQGERYLTFFIGLLNQTHRQLHYINAGHQPPLLLQDGSVTELTKGCTILGYFRELQEVEVGVVDIPGEAFLLCFTDGLIDIQNEQGKYYEINQLKDFAQRHTACSATEFNEKLLTHLQIFQKEPDFPDDFTLLTCRVKAPC